MLVALVTVVEYVFLVFCDEFVLGSSTPPRYAGLRAPQWGIRLDPFGLPGQPSSILPKSGINEAGCFQRNADRRRLENTRVEAI